MKIYTKTGDDGTTALYGGTRVPKYHLRIEAYGTVDELNSYIGLIRSQNSHQKTNDSLLKIQNDLFTLGSMLATPSEKETLKSGKERLNIPKVDADAILFLENEIDKMNETIPPISNFVLPGGNSVVSHCHIARCVCRRAERITVQLSEETDINKQLIIYLNRLSDYLFVLARKLTYEYKIDEIPWIPTKNK